MFLSRQFHSDAFEQPIAYAIQRSADALLGSLKLGRNLAAAEVVDIVEVEQFLVGNAEFRLALPQCRQIGFGVIVLAFNGGVREDIEQSFADRSLRVLAFQMIAYRNLRRLACPCEKTAARTKRFKLAPENQTDGLIQVVGVSPIPYHGEYVAVQFALVTSQQLREQTLTVFFVHHQGSIRIGWLA